MSSLRPNTPESEPSPFPANRPVLDYATPVKRPRRLFRQFLVVLDPWIAIAAAIPLLCDEFALRSGEDFHYQRMIGNNQWSLFTWCWRIAANQWLFLMELAGSIILIAVACAPSRFRRRVYWVYLPTFALGYALSWAAWAYLETQLQGVWSCCLPYANAHASTIMLALLISNPAATVLLIRLIAPNVKFAGPSDKT